MCGIIGVAGTTPVDKETLYSGIKALHHRGPESRNLWQNQDTTVNLGHSRLRIIDLDGGGQPLTSYDEQLVAVVNGEFYDYKRIRKELSEWGYTFKTNTDSELLLGLYERYGIGCLDYLRGEFAFILWDKRNQWLFAARDNAGIKPLFYYLDNDTLYLASEVKALKALGVPLQWNEDQFYQSLTMLPSSQESLFKNIAQIPPGHYLVKRFRATSINIKKYWDFNYPKIRERPKISEEEAVEGFTEVFKEAVSLRLQADVPVGCYLSGGLDSCSILGFAQSLSETRITTFTLSFDHCDYDESAVAKEMAQFAGAKFTPVPVTQREIADNFENAVSSAEVFLNNGHAVAKYMLSRAVNDMGIKVVLTGEGSDEIFGGYPHFRQDQILYGKNGYSSHEKNELLTLIQKNNKVSEGVLFSRELHLDPQPIVQRMGFLPGWINGFSVQKSLADSILNEEFAEYFGRRNPVLYLLSEMDFTQLNGRDALDKSLFLWSKSIFPYYLLTALGDRMEMAHSVEGRMPFLDKKVMEYVVKLPPELKVKRLTEKYILKESARPYITDTVYRRQKHPFLAPLSIAKDQPPQMLELIQDTLRSHTLKSLPFVDQAKTVDFLDKVLKHKKLTNTSDMLLNNLLSACFLHKNFEL